MDYQDIATVIADIVKFWQGKSEQDIETFFIGKQVRKSISADIANDITGLLNRFSGGPDEIEDYLRSIKPPELDDIHNAVENLRSVYRG